MIVEFSRIAATPVKRKWAEIVNAILGGEEVSAVQSIIKSEAFILKLIF
jgi:hypothetical protein